MRQHEKDSRETNSSTGNKMLADGLPQPTSSRMPTEGSSRNRRRRRHASEEEEEPISMWKIGVVIAVIVLCFGMLYPTLFHPFVASLFSKSAPPVNQMPPNRPPIHPSMGGGPKGRPDMHPGMRMAGSQAQGATTGGGSKGMIAWFLPLYTIGVVSFLLYTLFKSKKKKKHRRANAYSSEESDEDEEEEEQCSKHNASNLKLGKKKLQGLQERLKQTEMAMEKILEQLGTIAAERQEVSKEEVDGEEQEIKGTEAPVQKNDKYLKDLEKALKDFKRLSKNREQMKNLKKEAEAGSEEDDEEERFEEAKTKAKADETSSEEMEEAEEEKARSDDENDGDVETSKEAHAEAIGTRRRNVQGAPEKTDT